MLDVEIRAKNVSEEEYFEVVLEELVVTIFSTRLHISNNNNSNNSSLFYGTTN